MSGHRAPCFCILERVHHKIVGVFFLVEKASAVVLDIREGQPHALLILTFFLRGGGVQNHKPTTTASHPPWDQHYFCFKKGLNQFLLKRMPDSNRMQLKNLRCLSSIIFHWRVTWSNDPLWPRPGLARPILVGPGRFLANGPPPLPRAPDGRDRLWPIPFWPS